MKNPMYPTKTDLDAKIKAYEDYHIKKLREIVADRQKLLDRVKTKLNEAERRQAAGEPVIKLSDMGFKYD